MRCQRSNPKSVESYRRRPRCGRLRRSQGVGEQLRSVMGVADTRGGRGIERGRLARLDDFARAHLRARRARPAQRLGLPARWRLGLGRGSVLRPPRLRDLRTPGGMRVGRARTQQPDRDRQSQLATCLSVRRPEPGRQAGERRQDAEPPSGACTRGLRSSPVPPGAARLVRRLRAEARESTHPKRVAAQCWRPERTHRATTSRIGRGPHGMRRDRTTSQRAPAPGIRRRSWSKCESPRRGRLPI